MTTTFTLNGESKTVYVGPQMPLPWVLRDVLNLAGTKFGRRNIAKIDIRWLRMRVATPSARQKPLFCNSEATKKRRQTS